MDTVDDIKLLREYGLQDSEAAFATLVERHVSLVYSTVLRQVVDRQLAEEVTQAVMAWTKLKTAATVGLGLLLTASTATVTYDYVARSRAPEAWQLGTSARLRWSQLPAKSGSCPRQPQPFLRPARKGVWFP